MAEVAATGRGLVQPAGRPPPLALRTGTGADNCRSWRSGRRVA